MKKNPLLAFLTIATAASMALSSCTDLAKKLDFDLNMVPVSVTVTIPAYTDSTGNVTVGPTTSSYNVDSFITAQTNGNLSSSNIQSVKVKSITLSLTNATAESNFQDFKSCTVSFHSNSNSNPYEVNISDNPDVYATTLTLPVDPNTDLKSYIGNTFTYTISGEMRHPVRTPLSCTITYSFDVKVHG
jgi:hypothetical protein